MLDRFGIAYDKQVVSAHRMPDALFAFAEQAAGRGVHEHAAELATAEHGDGAAVGLGVDRGHVRSCDIARAAAVCSARKASSCWRSAASRVASIATANSAALAAPAGPMAKVATGMPLGI